MHHRKLAILIVIITSQISFASTNFNNQQLTKNEQLASNLFRTSLPKEPSISSNSNPIFIYKSNLSAFTREDSINNEELIIFRNTIMAEHKFAPSLIGHGEASFNFSGGHSQGYLDQIERRSGIFVEQAYIDWMPVHWLSISGGAHRENFLFSDTFINDVTFPTFNQTLKFGISNLEISVTFQQSIVTSTLLNSKTVEKEPTPTFLSQSLQGSYTQNDVLANAQLTLYQFNDLSSQVAFDSRRLGNTTDHITNQRHEFAYDFQGVNYALELAQTWTYPLATVLKWSLTENNKAPVGHNRSQQLSLTPKYRLGDNSFSLGYRRFIIQSDATPGYFNSSQLGHSNRQGFEWMTSIELVKYALKVSLRYIEANILDANPDQEDEKRVLLSLETSYVKF